MFGEKVTMDKCEKCGMNLSDDCVGVWKCNECGKMFKLSLGKLRMIQERKMQNVGKSLLKCSACGHVLDDGNEKIICKCSSCGNVVGGNLEYFAPDDLEDKIIETTMLHLDASSKKNTAPMNLVHCPKCGKKILSDSKICSYCGYEMATKNEHILDDKKEIPLYKSKRFISILMRIIGSILLIISITRITNDDYKFYKQHYQDCMDGYNDTKSIADSYLGGYFKSSYNSIASSYKDMADDDNKKIWIFRIQAIALACGGFALIIYGYKKGKKKMALIKCPECGRENVSDTAKACPGCGYGIKEHFDKIGRENKEKVHENVKIEEEIVESHVLPESEIDNKQESLTDTSNRKMLYGVCAVLAVVSIIVVIAVMASENAKKCTMGSCDNYKMEGSDYCKEHTCKEEGCYLSKSRRDTYCYQHEKEHQCIVDGCDNMKYGDSDYCSEHKCEQAGCNNKKSFLSDYCEDHIIDMRKRLTDSSFYFFLNSAGGIEFDFSAKNFTGKEIKYVRFNVELRNAVGDRVEDEIKNTTSVSVEIVGPIEAGSKFSFSDIIGYCDTCARIDIDDITIVYKDGTSETGHFGYYYEK